MATIGQFKKFAKADAKARKLERAKSPKAKKARKEVEKERARLQGR